MIPLHDNIQIRSFPFITILLIVSNCCIFFLERSATDQQLAWIMAYYSLVPAEFVNAITLHPFQPGDYLPLLSNLFLHGGWAHIIGNLWFLWLFGRTSEGCLGHLTYLVFYLVCGLASNFVQVFFDTSSTIPIIGASGAISGLLGSYYFCFPRAHISALTPVFLFFTIIEIPALVFIAAWFLLQACESDLSSFITGSNVAWWAHVGGFFTGIGLNVILKIRRS